MTETDELGGLQFLEVRSTLPDELLMYADKLSMAHGLELRVPFVDKEIVEYVERLPASLKVRAGSRKWLHRRVCRAFLPESVVKRPKRGFAVNVVDDWFRGAIDNKMADSLLDPESRLYQYLKPEAVRDLFEGHSAGRSDNHKILFSLVLFEEWLRVHEQPAVVASQGR
jgi:asparagine synthase (glutamine-hydrolysing)